MLKSRVSDEMGLMSETVMTAVGSSGFEFEGVDR